jgi:hypothetical protein
MSDIRIGDNGTVIELQIVDDVGIVDLRGTVVEVLIKLRAKRINKIAQIKDGLKGLCEFTLNREDIDEIASYSFQATVKFPDGKEFASSIGYFTVGKKL